MDKGGRLMVVLLFVLIICVAMLAAVVVNGPPVNEAERVSMCEDRCETSLFAKTFGVVQECINGCQ